MRRQCPPACPGEADPCGQKQVKLTGTCQVDFDAARTRLLDSNSDTLALLPTNGIRSLGVNPACSFSLDDHDREGLALFAENRALDTHFLHLLQLLGSSHITRRRRHVRGQKKRP